MNENASKIGARIREIRQRKGLTQKQLGELCGMADSAIRRYESGRAEPKIKTIETIADALQVNLSELAYGSTPSNTKYYQHFEKTLRSIANSGLDAMVFVGDPDSAPPPLPKTTLSEVKRNFDFPLGELAFIENYLKLNRFGKKEALKRVAELTRLEEYTKPDTSAPMSDQVAADEPEPGSRKE